MLIGQEVRAMSRERHDRRLPAPIEICVLCVVVLNHFHLVTARSFCPEPRALDVQ